MLQQNLTKDCWTHVFSFLQPSDIINLSSTCHVIYRAIASGPVRNRLSATMINPFKPNYQQWIILQIIKDTDTHYWISGGVGVGKSVVAMVSALKKTLINNKIIISVPSNLLSQWNELLINQFGIQAFIMHALNKKYKSIKYKDESLIHERVVLTTPKVFVRKLTIFNPENTLIVDEAHDMSLGFKHCIAINAFPSSYPKYPIYTIEENICITKLLPIKEYIHKLPVPPEILSTLSTLELYTAPLTTLFSYPFIKYHALPSTIKYKDKEIKRRLNPNFLPKDENFFFLENSPKFIKLLNLTKELQSDNAILFDRTTDYLPYLALLLEKNGINTILFTTDFNPVQRISLLDEFKSSKGCVLLSSYNIMGEGHNLPEANHIICFGSCGNLDMKNQIIGRCQRFRQTKQVHVHRLYSSPVDEYLDNNYLSKYNFLFKGASRRIKMDMMEKIYGGYGFWSFKSGYIESGVDINQVLDSIENKVIKVGTIGKYIEFGNIKEFTVLAFLKGGDELQIQKANQCIKITKRRNGKYYEINTSTSNTEYYF